MDIKPDLCTGPYDYKVTSLNREEVMNHNPVTNEITESQLHLPQQTKLTQLSFSSVPRQHLMPVGVQGINLGGGSGGGIVTGLASDPTVQGCISVAHQQPPLKRVKVWPSKTEQIMIYVRQDTETTYTALHLVSEKKITLGSGVFISA